MNLFIHDMYVSRHDILQTFLTTEMFIARVIDIFL